MRYRRTLSVVVWAGVLLSLSSNASGRKTDDFDPLGFPGDDAVITESVQAADRPRDIDTSAIEAPVQTASAVADSTIVLRVQFFASTDPSRARDVKKRAEALFADSVSLTFETPYYKLRTGVFDDYDRAEAFAFRLRAMGYESAWVVRTDLPFQGLRGEE